MTGRRLMLRLLAGLDAAWLGVRRRRAASASAVVAGAGVQATAEVGVWEGEGISWPEFPQLAHSFWRAQELTLFRQHRELFREPALDLGCGDRIFGRLAGFPQRCVGVDYDWGSLVAEAPREDRTVKVRGDAGHLPLATGSVAVCLSNSVLEHLPDLELCLSEVFRVLRPTGRFIFSMTLGHFTAQLRNLSGERDASQWVRWFGHHQQPSESQLLGALASRGFALERSISYQPESATALYRLLVSPAFQYLERRWSPPVIERWRGGLALKVRESLASTPAGGGACVFVVARKP